ncbi:hypothetical protein ACWOFB_11925 [Enterococcus hermanniensis]
MSTIKQHRVRFSISLGICLLALFSLTTLGVLKVAMGHLNTSTPIKLFSSAEIDQLQQYFSNGLIACSIFLILSLLLFFVFRFRRWKNQEFTTNRMIYETGLECFLSLLLATIFLILLFALFEPTYEAILQNLYHKGLDQISNLPKTVISNGNNGIVYSTRSSLTFDFSSATLLDMFFKSLIKSILYILLNLVLLTLGFKAINLLTKKHKVR